MEAIKLSEMAEEERIEYLRRKEFEEQERRLAEEIERYDYWSSDLLSYIGFHHANTAPAEVFHCSYPIFPDTHLLRKTA